MQYRQCCVCGSDQSEMWYKPPRSPGPIVQCKQCGFVYVNPIESDKSLIQEGPVLGDRPQYLLESSDLSEIKGSWEEPIIERYMQEYDAKAANAAEALQHINRLKPNRGKILDFGCFCGAFLSVAKSQGWDAYGLEPLVMPSIFARGKFGLKVVTDTLRSDNFPPETFDAVTAFQVFEHIVDPVQELEKLRGFIRPGGIIMIEVPNIETTLVKVMKQKHRHYVEDHVSFYSADTLKRLLANYGFQAVEEYYPVRTLSVHHLAWWMGRFAGSRVGEGLQKLVDRADLGSKTVNLSLGDIVSVIAQKT